MPPKKLPSKLTNQGSLAIPATPPAPTTRQPLAPPVLAASETIPPLWAPPTPPRAVFPEWPANDTFAPGHWHSFDAPFEDPLPTSELLLPFEVRSERESIQWQRPREFLLPIVDPTPPSAPPPLPAVHADLKNAKKAVAVPPKKAEADKKAATAPHPPAPPKHAHIFYVSAKSASDRSLPATPDPHQQVPLQHELHIPRDFRRLWSAEQLDALEQWRKEEARIEVNKQQRERVYMAFEDAIAYIVNERPRGMLDDVEIDPDDLVDDGHDDDHDDGHLGRDGAGGSDESPWGVLPPAPIDILPNAVLKPESPHGEVVHADMASYFRIVEELLNAWQLSDPGQTNPHSSAHARPFLWRAIYPQDTRGFPIYNPGGKYSVKLFVLGKWRRVDVDDRLPVDPSGKVVYATSSMASEIWPALLTKALYKAMQWLHLPGSDEGESGSKDDSTHATCVAAQTLLLLTGWKVSRWNPGAATSFSENVYHQLLPFVPRQLQHHHVERSAALDGSTTRDSNEPVQDDAREQQVSVDGAVVVDEAKSTPSASPEGNSASRRKPRALICCADSSNTAARSLRFCETAVLNDIIGDAGNTTFKIVRHGAPVNISEDTTNPAATANAFVLLLVHPPPTHVVSTIHTWTEAVSDEKQLLVPFENPPAQFALVQLLEKKANDNDQDQGNAPDDEDEVRPSVVATLTPVHGSRNQESSGSEAPDSPSSSTSRAVAKLLRLDPRGSLSLVEEPIGASRGGTATAASAPTLVTLDTVSSSHLDLSLAKGPVVTTWAFRIFPQRSLARYGYCLELESSSVSSIQLLGVAGFWRALGHLHIEEVHRTYPVMLPNTWNVLVQQVLTMDNVEGGEVQQVGHNEMELRVDLHVSDAELTRFLHVSVVNNATNDVVLLPTLCCSTRIPLTGSTDAAVFTVIVDCAPGAQPVRAGAWHLTLGCTRKFSLTPSPASTVSTTTFGGVYEPNRDLVLFRDVVTPPAKAVATSFQLEVIEIDGASELHERVVEDLAVQLEVFDVSNANDGDAMTKPPPLVQARGKGATRLLQLPRPASTSTTNGATRFILQGTIDRSSCDVPSSLQSRRPFHNNTAHPPLVSSASAPIDEAQDPASDGVPVTDDNKSKTALQWRLRCWSAEEVKMDVDRTKELRHEAIRARWAEQARDRETSGAASRLLFLGQHEAAEARMQQEQSPTEERAEALRNRFTWLREVLDRSEASEHKFLTTISASDEDTSVVTRQELEKNEQELADQLRLAQMQLEERRAARVGAKDQRAADWKADVQRVINERAAAAKLRAARRQELADATSKSA